MMRRQMSGWVGGGLAVLVAAVGCGGPGGDYKTAQQIKAAAPHDDHDHGHGAEGSHHGSLVELGEHEHHAEIVVDGKAHVLRIFLLGPDAKSAATTAAKELTLVVEGGPTLTLKPAADQEAEKHAVFELADEKAVHELAEAGFIHGTLKVQVGEKTYEAGVDAHFDGDHDHGHEEMPKADGAAAPAEPAAVQP